MIKEVGVTQPEQRIEREVLLPAEREEVWRALIEPELLAEWLADDVDLEAKEGGEVRARPRRGGVRHGQVEQVAEGERLRWRWT